ncbi:hypothetical protein PoB_006458500 [Plakobranchus ocellatus]|uniref:Uncharacterized protein n=1 Tax=Plakobranchus ocellatus TaxID=259542 RepID=A0AAV4D1V0_9GAST|nr:hypothetical protein PoB_006458500 [Plakobranchus ocellatus]
MKWENGIKVWTHLTKDSQTAAENREIVKTSPKSVPTTFPWTTGWLKVKVTVINNCEVRNRQKIPKKCPNDLPLDHGMVESEGEPLHCKSYVPLDVDYVLF